MSEPDATSEPTTSAAIGKDEWVARFGERQGGPGGPLGTLLGRAHRVPWWGWLAAIVAALGALPLITDNAYVHRVGFDIALYMLLALGLNLVVGWGGLLDLGYVAFYGVGAYAYALLSSKQLGVHLPALLAIPIVVVIGALVGYLVGLPSRRLVGDYLAIVTLFFLQIFGSFMTNGDNIFGHNITNGSNGILIIDPLDFFGVNLPVDHEGLFAIAYLYVALAVFAVVYTALHFINASRTGRAWRSIREDSLAAEAMGMPVNRLKLLAFSLGAAVAALTGSIFASLNTSTFPLFFSFALLIIVYTMVILGGQGSQAGVAVGAILIGAMLELLRDPANARYVFYGVVILGLAYAVYRSPRLGGVVAATVALGFAAHETARALHPQWVAGKSEEGGSLASALAHWVIVPTHLETYVAPVSYISLIAAVLVITLLHGALRYVLLVPTLYLAAFVWENVLVADAATRYILLGVILIVLMVVRPNGLFGERRVEIV